MLSCLPEGRWIVAFGLTGVNGPHVGPPITEETEATDEKRSNEEAEQEEKVLELPPTPPFPARCIVALETERHRCTIEFWF